MTGTILFGGIDTDKYVGSLKGVPIEPNALSNSYTSFTVSMSSLVAITNNGTTVSFTADTYPVILDSGTTLTYLPVLVAEGIFEAFNAYDDSEISGLVLVDCGYLNDSPDGIVMQYQFGGSSGPTINVTLDQIIQNDVQPYFDNGTLMIPPDLPFPSDSICSFGIQVGDDETYLLGDTFLRSAYVIYDLSNKEIALAQSNFNSTSANIIEITASATTIPLVSGVASLVATTSDPASASKTIFAFGTGLASSSGSASAAATTSKSAAVAGAPPASLEALAVTLVAGIFMLLGATTLIL